MPKFPTSTVVLLAGGSLLLSGALLGVRADERDNADRDAAGRVADSRADESNADEGATGTPAEAAPQGPVDPGANWDRSRNKDGRWNRTDVGPFLASVLPTPSGTIAKGLSIKLGEKNRASIAYDTATMSARAAWTGGFLAFDPEKFGIVRSPRIDGNVLFHDPAPDWGSAKVRFRGLRQHGRRVVLEYTVDGTTILETPTAATAEDGTVVPIRTLSVAAHERSLTLQVLGPKSRAKTEFAVDAPRDAFTIVEADGVRAISIAPAEKTVTLRVALGVAKDTLRAVLAAQPATAPESLRKPGPRLWKAAPVTRGTIAENDAPYVVDTIALPFENPWNALLFLTGLDFLPDGRLAVGTLYGDVFLVEGVDADLDRLVWRRFATGLHQPLGLKVVKGRIHVLGRDQITRLHDTDGNSEADFYECFNNAGQTSTSGHDYAACLETDPAGRFYYIRAHEGVVRVSADGTKSESIAQGFRNPVGLGVSPTGMVTATPQEGTWTPASSIIEVRTGGWYGFGGPKVTEDRPLGYDPPICWMPRLQDNSSGGQVWVTDERFGPLAGRMLHLSYGQCALLAVAHERVDGVSQGATVRLPMFFESGVLRGRGGPDGQLYVCGLRGWQTAAAKDGCLQRVRFTGRPLYEPLGFHVRSDGLELTFAAPLDPESATDTQNWAVEQWNYRYSKEYGSKDYRVSNPRKTGRDEVFIESAALSDDGRTVRLVFEEDVEPVMQIGITYDIRAADESPLKQTIYGTVNRVPKRR